MLYDMRRAKFLPLLTLEDVLSPQCHISALEVAEHGIFTSVNSSIDAENVVFSSDSSVDKALRRLKAMC